MDSQQKPVITQPSISVIIPVHNEAHTIQRAISRVVECGFEMEIIIIDDGSTDGTREYLRQLVHPKVRCYFHARNHGEGAALRLGFAAAKNQFIIVQDADFECDPRNYSTVLQPLLDDRADMVYGSRSVDRPQPALSFGHHFGNRLLALVSNALNYLNLMDMETGIKAFRRDRLTTLRLSSNRAAFDSEITCKAIRAGWRICEVPISFSGRSYERGKKMGWRNAISALAATIYYRFGD
jgi:glycosyltransferase involved in cell wall biosynthesis